MDFLSLIIDGVKAIGKAVGIGDKVEEVVNAISSDKLTPEQKENLAKAVSEHTEKMESYVVALRGLDVDEHKTEIQSEDLFVRRARPMFLYVVILILLLNYGGSAVAHWFSNAVTPITLPPDLLTLFGVMVGGYMWLRSKDKLNGNGK